MISTIKKSLKKGSSARKILDNISWLFFDKFFKMGVGLFVGIWFARYLGPEQFGTWNYVLSVITILTVISGLGLDSIVTREIVKDSENTKSIVGTALILRLLSSTILYICLFIYSFFTYYGSDNTILWLFIIMSFSFFFQSFNVIDFYFQSNLQSKYSVIARNIAFILSTILKVYLIVFKKDLIMFAIVFSLEFFLTALLLIYAYVKHGQGINFKLINDKLVTLFKLGIPLLITSMAINIYMRVDQLMLKHILDDEAVGFYAAAVKITEIWTFIPAAISYSLFPSIIKLKTQGGEIYHKKLKYLIELMLLLALFIIVPIYFLSDEIILLLFGEEYYMSINVLKVHTWVGIFIFIGLPARKVLIAEDLQTYISYIAILALSLNIVLNSIFIPMYGIDGAVYATLISYAFGSYFFYAFFKKTRFVFKLQTSALFMNNIFRILSKKKFD